MLPRPAPRAVATARAHELRIRTLAAARARRILDVLDLVEGDVDELAAHLLHPPDVDRLHHVAGIGVDRHRSARAHPLQPLGRRDQGIAVGVAARFLQRLVDGVHAVIDADREEVGVAPVHFVEHLDEFDVERRVALVVVMPGGDQAEAGVAHRFQRLLRRGLAGAQNLGLVEIDAALGKSLAQRGIDFNKTKVLGSGETTAEQALKTMGDAGLGLISAWHYDYKSDAPLNVEFVKVFNEMHGRNPDFFSIGVYDGMHAIYEALKKTGGNTDGDALIAAAKGLKWNSPRGPMSIDPDTRDVVQTIYIRRVQKVGGELINVPFDKIENVMDPTRARGG